MEKKVITSKKGFTLIELVIIIAIISIMAGISINSFGSSIKKYNLATTKEKVLQAKNSYFASHDIDLTDFIHFYFVYDDVVYKGDASGGINIFTGFESVDKTNYTMEIYNSVVIYHPSSIGYYSIQIYLENSVDSGIYYLFHTAQNLTGYVGTTKNADAKDILGYIYNPDKSSMQTSILEDYSQNIIKVYYNKLPIEKYTVYVYLETGYKTGEYPAEPNQIYMGSGYEGDYTEVQGITKKGYTLVEPIEQIMILREDDENYTGNIVYTYYQKDATEDDDVIELASQVYINDVLVEDASNYLEIVDNTLTSKGLNASGINDVKIVLDSEDGILYIGNNAFKDCTKLTSITLCDTISTIGENAFYGTSIKTITIPHSVTEINSAAFMDCKQLYSVTFSGISYIEKINNRVFRNCSDLKTILLPNNIIDIGEEAFAYSGLTKISIPNSVKTIGNGAFVSCGSLSSVNIADSVKTIGENAFSNCVFTEVNLPLYLEKINNAFDLCENLKTVYYSGNNDTIISYLESLGVNIIRKIVNN